MPRAVQRGLSVAPMTDERMMGAREMLRQRPHIEMLQPERDVGEWPVASLRKPLA